MDWSGFLLVNCTGLLLVNVCQNPMSLYLNLALSRTRTTKQNSISSTCECYSQKKRWRDDIDKGKCRLHRLLPYYPVSYLLLDGGLDRSWNGRLWPDSRNISTYANNNILQDNIFAFLSIHSSSSSSLAC